MSDEKKKKAGWQPGQSGNPAGRKRNSESLAEAVRKKWPAEKIVEVMTKHAKSKDEGVSTRAVEWLADRGYGKAPQTVDLNVTTEEASPVDWGAIPIAERERLIAALDTADKIALPEGDDDKADQ